MSLRHLQRLARRSQRPLRVGIVRLAHETNAWNPVPTTFADFERAHLLEGEALGRACARGATEVEGYVKNAELSGAVQGLEEAGATPVPLLSLWAIPSGPIAAEALGQMHARLQDALDGAGPLDAVVVAMHGAMTSVHDHLPEVGFLQRIRDHVGEAPVVLTLDLHAQLSPPKVALVDAVLAYQTNPHRDHARVGRKAGLLAAALARRQVRAYTAWRMVPMIFGGGTTIDLLPTMRPAFSRMWRIDRRPEVLHASLFMSHLWHDAPDLGWATCVLTDTALDPDGAAAESHADDLADALWAVRTVDPPDFLDVPTLVEEARGARWARRLGVVAVSDASDNVAAGGHGANSNLVRDLLAHGQGLLSYAPLRAPAALAALREHAPGDAVSVEVGGDVHPEMCPAVPVSGRLRSRSHHDVWGETVVLDLDHVQLVLTEAPPLVMKPAFYRDAGLDPWAADILVAKSMFHFRLYFLPIARKTRYVRTRGVTDLDLAVQQELPHPVWPQVDLDDWRAEDRRRRGA